MLDVTEKPYAPPVGPPPPTVPPPVARPAAPDAPHTKGLAQTPEYRFAAHLLRGLREDLVRGGLAHRPLRKAGTDGPWARRLPARLRPLAAWAPHTAVVCLALTALVYGTSASYGAHPTTFEVLDGALPMGAVLLTLVRPVTAFWASLVVDTLAAIAGTAWTGSNNLPWLPGSLVGHLAVLTVVALRTGARAAAWMWVLTAGYGVLASVAFDEYGGSDALPMTVTSAVLLLCVSIRDIHRTAQREVTAERHVSAAERSRRALLEERTTIARELHDVVAHHMSVVAIQAEAAPYRVADPPPELTQAFATIRENAVAALAELRRLLGVVRVEDYQAPDAPQPTLADLDALLTNVRQAGLDVTLTVTGAVRELPQGVELSAYRIVQEALSNVLRHAPGAPCRVEVSHVLGGLGLRVVNGPATEPARPSPGTGHGVTGMRERVTMLGGAMTAGRTADGGYEVAAFLPVTTGPDDGKPVHPQDRGPDDGRDREVRREPGRGPGGQAGRGPRTEGDAT